LCSYLGCNDAYGANDVKRPLERVGLGCDCCFVRERGGVSEKIVAIPHNGPARPVELTFVELILETEGAAANHTIILELLLELPP
jgi:hypothetical protein